jgi:hypothetical protein
MEDLTTIQLKKTTRDKLRQREAYPDEKFELIVSRLLEKVKE